MGIIKLKDLLVKKKLNEAPVTDVPPEVRIVVPNIGHAYNKAAGTAAGKPYTQPNIDFSEKPRSEDIITKSANVIKKFENSVNNPRGGFNKQVKKWFPHKSIEGGSDTIAYGHKIQKGEEAKFKNGISDDDAMKLLEKDIKEKADYARRHINNFDALPLTVKIATINALYRGDMGPKTMNLLSQNKFGDAAKEYLNHREYRNTKNSGVKKRMDWNAKVFASAG